MVISHHDLLTPHEGTISVAENYAHNYYFGLGALLPELSEGLSSGSKGVSHSLKEVSLNSKYYDAARGFASIENQNTLMLPIKSASGTGDIGTITVLIHSENFLDMEATIKVTAVNKLIPERAPVLSPGEITYGQPVSTISLSGQMKAARRDVLGTFRWVQPENFLPRGATAPRGSSYRRTAEPTPLPRALRR